MADGGILKVDRDASTGGNMYAKITVEVRERFESTAEYPLWRAIVTTSRGRCYACTFAGDAPSEDHVRQVWLEDRKAFDPYHL